MVIQSPREPYTHQSKDWKYILPVDSVEKYSLHKVISSMAV